MLNAGKTGNRQKKRENWIKVARKFENIAIFNANKAHFGSGNKWYASWFSHEFMCLIEVKFILRLSNEAIINGIVNGEREMFSLE